MWELYNGSEEVQSELSRVIRLSMYDKSGDKVKVKSKSNDILPLKLGNRWTYIYTFEGENSSETMDIIRRITAVEKRGNDIYYTLLSRHHQKLITKKSDGIHIYEYGREYLSVRYPTVKRG